MKKCIVAFIMLLPVMLLITGGLLYSNESLGVYYENHTVSPGMMSVYVNATNHMALIEGTLTFSLSGQQLSILDTHQATDKGVSYLFAVDVSGSMHGERIELLKQALSELVSRLDTDDNVAFLTFGDDTARTPFYDKKEDMMAFIDGLAASREDTNLYKGLVVATQLMSTDNAVQPKRLIVVFSDGEDDIIEGYTREEAERAVSQSRIPVLTVSVQSRIPSEKAIDASKILAGFARQSAGGISQVLIPDGDPPGDIAQHITEYATQSHVFDLALSGINLPNDQSLLEIKLEYEYQTATDSIMLNAMSLRANIRDIDEPELLKGRWLLFAITGIVLSITIVIFIIVVLKRKHITVNTAEKDIKESPTLSPKPLWRFTISKVGFPESDEYAVSINEELTIGRNTGQLKVPSDMRLSSVHCRIFWMNGRFYLEDLKSTNGTYLNGIPVSQRQPIEQGDIILAGSAEMRVRWEALGKR